MILLNDPYREWERKERRRRIEAVIGWLATGFAWMLLGYGLARLISP